MHLHLPAGEQAIAMLQTAISPVILISGVGLLLLSMTNRLGRVIDRARALYREWPKAQDTPTAHNIRTQLVILRRRAKYIQIAITLTVLSALSAVGLIMSLFIMTWLKCEWAGLIGGLFLASVGCLGGALLAFIADINEALSAMHVEVDTLLQQPDQF